MVPRTPHGVIDNVGPKQTFVDENPDRARRVRQYIGVHRMNSAVVHHLRPAVQTVLLERKDNESGFLHQSEFADVLVHGPGRRHRSEQVEFNEFAVRFLKELEGVVDGVVAGVLEILGLVVVVDEDGESAASELDEAEGVDGERAADGGIRDFEEVDEAGDTFLVVDAGDNVELGVWRGVLDGPPFVNHVRS
ncbi:hypothetical protein U1Q18_033570 [Sarracenia purpurea var. burkii]